MDGLVKLKQNIHAYLKRVYLSQIISGLLITTGLLGLLWVVFSLLEYVFRFGSDVRMILFYGFAFIAIGLVVIQIGIPALRYFGVLAQKNSSEAADDIGRKIASIEDRLKNILSLEATLKQKENALAKAGLLQKAEQLSGFRFSDAVELKSSFRWIGLTLIPMLFAVFIFMWDSSILSDSTSRIFGYSQSFIPPAPFSFEIKNGSLEVAEGASFELEVQTKGNVIPNNVFLVVDGTEFRMKPISMGVFVFEFNNVRNDKQFQLRGASVYSQDFTLLAIPKPKLLRNEAYLNFPEYTKKSNETVVNRTKLVIPEGTQIKWKFDIKNSNTRVVTVDSLRVEGLGDENTLLIDQRFMNSALLKIGLKNDKGLIDTGQVVISVIRDANPLMGVEERLDTSAGNFYFQGRLSDDYGITELNFISKIGGVVVFNESLPYNAEMLDQGFSFAWNPDSLINEPGEELIYYFEVWDNDGVNGSKSSRSRTWSLKVPSLEELNEESSERASKTKSALSESSSDLDKMKKELEDLRKDLLDKKKPDWQDREALKEMLDRQKKMMENLEQKAQEQRIQERQNEKFNRYSEELMQKQEMIQEMFEKLFDDEFKEKYEEMNRLLEEMNKTDMLEKLEQMDLNNEQLEKELDRTLELFKQLEFEKKVEENIERLDELIKDQSDLKDKTENKDLSKEELAKDQGELNERAEKLQEELQNMEDLNQSLEEPNSLPETEELAEGANEDMDEAKEELDKGNEGKASTKQGEARDKMEQMKEALTSFQEEQAQGREAENLEDMRQLLENILDLSISQEQVMQDLKPVKGSDPKFVELTKSQKNLVDDTKVVEDSLLALSKRLPQIGKVINDEMTAVKYSMAKSLSHMSDQPPNREDQYKAMTLERQQYAMTSLNNLALLFDEIKKNMQKQMAPMTKGNGKCDKPGSGKGGKPSASDMKKMQESLNKQLEALKKALEKGENPNGKKPGQKPGQENGASGQGGLGGGLSKEIAQMAAQQAAMRKQIREMSESLNGNGGGSGKDLKEIEKMMEQRKEDILFQKISSETMKRQQDIMTKLLESEKADREREYEQRRESKSPVTDFVIPEEIWNKFELEKKSELELYKTMPPSLKPFYRNEVNRYFSNFQTN